MSVQLSSPDLISMSGECSLEDAESLWHLLTMHPHATVDWSACTGGHSAAIQVLLVAKPKMLGTPTNDFLARHMLPLVSRGD